MEILANLLVNSDMVSFEDYKNSSSKPQNFIERSHPNKTCWFKIPGPVRKHSGVTFAIMSTVRMQTFQTHYCSYCCVFGKCHSEVNVNSLHFYCKYIMLSL